MTSKTCDICNKREAVHLLTGCEPDAREVHCCGTCFAINSGRLLRPSLPRTGLRLEITDMIAVLAAYGTADFLGRRMVTQAEW